MENQKLELTPSNTWGHYYVKNAPFRAKLSPFHDIGKILIIKGTVRNRNGEPLPFVNIELWQVGMDSKYDYIEPEGEQIVEEGENNNGTSKEYNYRVRLITNEFGQYELETLKPLAYVDERLNKIHDDMIYRAPHIHFFVRSDGYKKLVTQLFFKGEEKNAEDKHFNEQCCIELELKEFDHISYYEGTFDLVLEESLNGENQHPKLQQQETEQKNVKNKNKEKKNGKGKDKKAKDEKKKDKKDKKKDKKDKDSKKKDEDNNNDESNKINNREIVIWETVDDNNIKDKKEKKDKDSKKKEKKDSKKDKSDKKDKKERIKENKEEDPNKKDKKEKDSKKEKKDKKEKDSKDKKDTKKEKDSKKDDKKLKIKKKKEKDPKKDSKKDKKDKKDTTITEKKEKDSKKDSKKDKKEDKKRKDRQKERQER